MGHYVYKYVLNDEIIYIGKNDSDLANRIYCHGREGDNIPKSGWDEINNAKVFYVELANSIMSDVFESEMIRRYKPKYNKAKTSDWSGLPFVEPEWSPFTPQKEYEVCNNDIPKYLQSPYTYAKRRRIVERIKQLHDINILLRLIQNRFYIQKLGYYIFPLHQILSLRNWSPSGSSFCFKGTQYGLYKGIVRGECVNYVYVKNSSYFTFIPEIIAENQKSIEDLFTFLAEHYPDNKKCLKNKKNKLSQNELSRIHEYWISFPKIKTPFDDCSFYKKDVPAWFLSKMEIAL